MNFSDHSKISLNFSNGIPSYDFLGKAWASEPLTNVLTETNIPFALPEPDKDISLIAEHQGEVVGQCSANRVVKYWDHVEKIDSKDQNLSTQIFVRIHKKAVETEKKYLEQIHEPAESSFHSAGIAVLPEYRGKNIGLSMRAKQIELCREHKATTLFCETTNRFSAATVEKSGFTRIAEYPYSLLADELNHNDLKKLDDSFTIWCLRP
jgi:GNAT superfamily N-acetyltransferase